MKIDAHNHAFWLHHDYDKTIQNMDEFGIDKTVLLSWECPRDEYDPISDNLYNNLEDPGPVDFKYALEFYNKCPERFFLGYAPDPRKPGALQKLKNAVEKYPISLYGELKIRMMLDNFDAVETYRYCGEQGLPVVVHLDYPINLETPSGPRSNYWYCGDIETLERALKLCPETNFMGHAPGFWAHISNDGQAVTTDYPKGPVVPGGAIERMLEKYPNLYCDISAYSGVSALARDTAYTKNLIMQYPDRFLYARDCFNNSHADLIESLCLPEDVKEKIFSKNFLRIAKIK